MKNQISTVNKLDIDDISKLGKYFVESKMFSDMSSVAMAVVKIIAGQELGLPTFASISGIHIVNGKPVLAANTIATLIKKHPEYDYKIKELNEKICTIEIYFSSKLVGEASFTMQEAINAGLSNKAVWKAYPTDMLFARAISRSARRFAADIFGGTVVYTPEEMGVDVDEDGNIVNNNRKNDDPLKGKGGDANRIVVFETYNFRKDLINKIKNLASKLNIPEENIQKGAEMKGFTSVEDIDEETAKKWVSSLQARISLEDKISNEGELNAPG